MSFKFANYPNPAPPDLTNHFTINAAAKTDLWDKPPSTRVFNCPILYQSITLASFKKARVAISAEWKDRYDQGGLCIIVNQADGPRKWIKAGIECIEGSPHVSIVATDRWSDWSLRPMPSQRAIGATIEMSKQSDGSLWIYLLEGVQRSPLREVTWLADIDGKEECWVGVYAAKPSNEGRLQVSFAHLMVETE